MGISLKKELFDYRKQILNDSGPGHSLLELLILIINQKYIWPFVIEFESELNEKNESFVQKFDLTFFMDQNANFWREHPMLFLILFGKNLLMKFPIPDCITRRKVHEINCQVFFVV